MKEGNIVNGSEHGQFMVYKSANGGGKEIVNEGRVRKKGK